MNRIQIGFNPDPSRTAMFSTFKAPAQTVDFCCCLIAVWPDGCVSLANYQASRRPPRRPTNRLVRLVGPPSQITRREMGTKGIDPRSPLHLSVIILFFSLLLRLRGDLIHYLRCHFGPFARHRHTHTPLAGCFVHNEWRF